MFTIYDGRKIFYQWDCKQKFIVKDQSIKEVHIANVDSEVAYTVATYQKDNLNMCDVPDILMESPSNITAYAYLIDEKGERTVYSAIFKVMERPMPDDYVPPEYEKKWSELEKRIETLENGGTSLVYKKTFETWEQLFELNEINNQPYKFKKADVYIKQATSTRTSVVQVGISESENIKVLGIYGTTPQLVHFGYEIKNKCLEITKYQCDVNGSDSFANETKAILRTDIENIESIYILNGSTDETTGYTVGTIIEVYAS